MIVTDRMQAGGWLAQLESPLQGPGSTSTLQPGVVSRVWPQWFGGSSTSTPSSVVRWAGLVSRQVAPHCSLQHCLQIRSWQSSRYLVQCQVPARQVQVLQPCCRSSPDWNSRPAARQPHSASGRQRPACRAVPAGQ